MREMGVNTHLTAMSRRELSAPVRTLVNLGFISYDRILQERFLDYGCGRGDDAHYLSIDKYDPYYFPNPPRLEYYDKILCTYVLNVVGEETQHEILERIRRCMRKPISTAYITVRRDIPKKGTRTQRYVELPGEGKFFTALSGLGWVTGNADFAGAFRSFEIYHTNADGLDRYLESIKDGRTTTNSTGE